MTPMKQICGIEKQKWIWPEQTRSRLQNGGKQASASAMGRPQRKRSWRGLLSMLTVLLWVAGLLSKGVQRSPASVGDDHLRILSANISAWGPQAEGILRGPAMERFQTMALAEHHFGCKQYQQIKQAVEAYCLPRHGSNSKTSRSSGKRGNDTAAPSGCPKLSSHRHRNWNGPAPKFSGTSAPLHFLLVSTFLGRKQRHASVCKEGVEACPLQTPRRKEPIESRARTHV